MPKILTSTPKYRLHRASGQAVVTIAGRDVYLGPHGTSVSRIEYDRVVGEWMAAGRPNQSSATTDITVVEVAAAFMKHARAGEHFHPGHRGRRCFTADEVADEAREGRRGVAEIPACECAAVSVCPCGRECRGPSGRCIQDKLRNAVPGKSPRERVFD